MDNWNQRLCYNAFLQDNCTGEEIVVFSISGDQGQDWHRAEVSILSSLQKHKYRIKFIGTSGSSFLGDIALDDVTISSGICGGQFLGLDFLPLIIVTAFVLFLIVFVRDFTFT